MRRKILFFFIALFTLLIPIHLSTATVNAAEGSEWCPDLNGTDYPRFSISANKSSMQWNEQITITANMSEAVKQKYIDNQTIFVIQGFRQPLQTEPISIGVNLEPRNPTWNPTGGPNTRTFSVTDLINQNGNTIEINPDQSYNVTFYYFLSAGFSSGPYTNDCKLSSNGVTVTIGGINEDPEADPDGECTNDPDPAGQYTQCADDQICDGETKRCIDKPEPAGGIKCEKPEDCFSGVCTNGNCDTGKVPFICKKLSRTVRLANGGSRTETYFSCKTAIGTFNADPESFSRSVLRLILGLAGGLLLILIIINGYKLMTSQGDPEKIKDAREGILAAIAGVLLIIFSLSILQLITVDIIGIPGFS